MKYGILGLVVAAGWYAIATPAAVPTPASGPVEQDRWNWRGRVAEGKTLEIRGISGSIVAEPATGNEVEVVADKRGRRDDPDDVRIEVLEHEGGVTICAVYPNSRRSRRPNTCEAGGGHSNTDNNDVEVEFTVRVPRGVRLDGNNVNGDVEATNLAGPVELSTVNGGVRLETSSGDARATTVNGSVTAVVRALGERSLRFSTVNGGINLSLPAGLNADLEARTVNGSIQSDFPISVTGRINPRRLAGRIGQGGRVLELETVNGSIRLRSLP